MLSELLDRLSNIANNFNSSCLCRKKFLKIKTDKILSLINYAKERLNTLAIIYIENWFENSIIRCDP